MCDCFFCFFSCGLSLPLGCLTQDSGCKLLVGTRPALALVMLMSACNLWHWICNTSVMTVRSPPTYSNSLKLAFRFGCTLTLFHPRAPAHVTQGFILMMLCVAPNLWGTVCFQEQQDDPKWVPTCLGERDGGMDQGGRACNDPASAAQPLRSVWLQVSLFLFM